ncbi:heparan sulfate 2-O-sulfotransferase hst-2-like [Penaeus japonicus]|uniref:heparan sulfate 2-O-sulfotransferase hst-2-like n=1 Tax=Penaeus japonicus TaxID=27405 RepID=UPI001C713D45|nr:heparan sulfate 2-O-sulfotransferase hst-2-like [Penaeus japonicus]
MLNPVLRIFLLLNAVALALWLASFLTSRGAFLSLRGRQTGSTGLRELQAFERRNRSDVIVTPVYPRFLVYNRVPKCGSATMLRLIRSLSRRHGFTLNNMRDTGLTHMAREQQLKLAEWTFNRPEHQSHFFFKHIYFINFTKLGYMEPSWINVVRHPISRYISHYYYRQPTESLDECYASGSCRVRKGEISRGLQLTYFCGHDTFCSIIGNRRALQVAKQVVESAYVVVGLMEHYRDTLEVLQHVLPGFFSKSTAIEYVNWNVQKKKPATSNATLAALHFWMKEELEFYEFVRQRFSLQLRGSRAERDRLRAARARRLDHD